MVQITALWEVKGDPLIEPYRRHQPWRPRARYANLGILEALMIRHPFTTAAVLLALAAATAPCQPKRVVFQGTQSSHTWALKDFDPALPSDWSGFAFLVVESQPSSPQRFELKIHNAGGVRAVRLSPVRGVTLFNTDWCAWQSGKCPPFNIELPAFMPRRDKEDEE